TYPGTLRRAGFWSVNPFTTRREVSLRAHNFNSDKLKVNDLRGNPIEIGAVVVWRVKDTAQAAFDVVDFASYVQVQTESALRHLASLHPYDAGDVDDVERRLRRVLDPPDDDGADLDRIAPQCLPRIFRRAVSTCYWSRTL